MEVNELIINLMLFCPAAGSGGALRSTLDGHSFMNREPRSDIPKKMYVW